ncbi:putative threonine efflux protein [Moritella sp. JT01]|uniref:LysE family translocator n=1 Tax=Moritella sp. JT01 TaxID=756698 RepID=UPI000791C15B|nr:LysE family translocator [Moritella sp. JT01]KXO09166.1 putative threonine efflux protein [Moritella sp. JT01]
MNFEIWLLFFVAYLIVTLSPGPNVLLVVKNAIKYGYKAASITILLNLFCQLVIITLVAFGAGALLAKSPILFFALKVIGGGYLIYLGITGLFTKIKAVETPEFEATSSRRLSYYKICKEAFLVSASNPKTVIFLSAFLPQFLSTNEPVFWQFAQMFLTMCFLVISVHLVYSYIAKNINNRFSTLKGNPIFSKITNSAFIIFGCGVLSKSRAT